MITLGTEDVITLKRLYREYVRDFDPTPQYLYDEPYRMLEFNEWLEEEYGLWPRIIKCTPKPMSEEWN